jgi:large subunit ribosomal protein L10
MAKSRLQKQQEVSEIVDALADAKGVVFANFAGLGVKATQDLRRKCREAGIRYAVAKKTLLKIAFEQAGLTNVNPRQLEGNISVVFGYSDEVAAARLLREFAKENEAITFVGGLIPQGETWSYLDATEVTNLSKLPSKEQLIGQLVGVIAAPLRNFVSVLNGPQRSLVQVLSAIQESKS